MSEKIAVGLATKLIKFLLTNLKYAAFQIETKCSIMVCCNSFLVDFLIN